MSMEPVSLTPTMHIVDKGSHHTYTLGKTPHRSSPTSQDVESWGPPAFQHWISYQLPVPWTASCPRLPLSDITQLTLLNLWFSFIHLQSLWDRTHPLPHGIKINNTKTISSWFAIDMILLSSHSHSLSHLISPAHYSLPVCWCLISEGLNKLV